ncbi:unnamed protein product [Orchesella dallaii]|uniref:Gustatory receptor n=1 Tax=Orchesella dallaii TaxID=48710 RepID=A0ABP1Q4T0_9HEXA
MKSEEKILRLSQSPMVFVREITLIDNMENFYINCPNPEQKQTSSIPKPQYSYFSYVNCIVDIAYYASISPGRCILNPPGGDPTKPFTWKDSGRLRKGRIIQWTLAILTCIYWLFDNVVTNFEADTQTNIIEEVISGKDGFLGHLETSGRFIISSFNNPFNLFKAHEHFNHTLAAGIEYPPAVVLSVGLFHTVIDIVSAFGWVTGDILIAIWGVHFCRILDIILIPGKEEQNKSCNVVNLKRIKLFTRFTILIEKFNDTVGYMILTCIASETMYISTRTAGILTGSLPSFMNLMINVLSFLPFIFTLLASAQVSYKARRLPCLFKEQFVNGSTSLSKRAKPCFANIERKGDTIDEVNDLADADNKLEEIKHGLMMIYHDLASNVIGFQGFFFTVTYGFVGTVLSGIATYSVIALQLTSDQSKVWRT